MLQLFIDSMEVLVGSWLFCMQHSMFSKESVHGWVSYGGWNKEHSILVCWGANSFSHFGMPLMYQYGMSSIQTSTQACIKTFVNMESVVCKTTNSEHESCWIKGRLHYQCNIRVLFVGWEFPRLPERLTSTHSMCETSNWVPFLSFKFQ